MSARKGVRDIVAAPSAKLSNPCIEAAQRWRRIRRGIVWTTNGILHDKQKKVRSRATPFDRVRPGLDLGSHGVRPYGEPKADPGSVGSDPGRMRGEWTLGRGNGDVQRGPTLGRKGAIGKRGVQERPHPQHLGDGVGCICRRRFAPSLPLRCSGGRAKRSHPRSGTGVAQRTIAGYATCTWQRGYNVIDVENGSRVVRPAGSDLPENH